MRTKTGIVISNKMKKTLVVRVNSFKAHLKYKKLMRISKKFYADDPQGNAQVGDTVTIYETRPLSKLKRWTLIRPEKV